MDFEQTLREACNSDEDSAVAVFQAYTFAATTDGLKHFNDAALRLTELPEPLNPLELGAVEIIPYAIDKATEDDGESQRLLELLGQHASPKELLLAANARLERLLTADDPEDDIGLHLRSITKLYTLAIPRLVLRKMPPDEILRLTMQEIVKGYELVAQDVSDDEGRKLLAAFLDLVAASQQWTKQVTESNSEKFTAMQADLSDDFNSVISLSLRHIASGIGLRAYQHSYPSALAPWRRREAPAVGDSGFNVIQRALTVSNSLGNTFESRLQDTRSNEPKKRTAALVLLAHDLEHDVSDGTLEVTLPAVLETLVSGSGVDEILAWLVRCLAVQSRGLTDEVVSPLLSGLVNFAALHPDPPTRQVALDTIARLIHLVSEELKLQYLSELLLECPYPQMKAAAIGLLKTSIAQALDSDIPSVLASSAVVLLLTSVLTPEPSDILNTDLSLPDFIESRECSRMTSALGLYYVVLRRDKLNKTGLRDEASVIAVKKLCLGPLGVSVKRWQSEPQNESSMALFALDGALQRVLETLARP